MNNFFKLGDHIVSAHGILKGYISKGVPEWQLELMIDPFPEESGGPEAPYLALLEFPEKDAKSLNPWLKNSSHRFEEAGAFYWTPGGGNIGAEVMSADLWRSVEHAPGVLSFKGRGLVDSGSWSGTGLFGENVPVLFSVKVTADTICCLGHAELGGVSDLAAIRRIFGELNLSAPEEDGNGHRTYKVLI
jgi:hypothetical protein